MARLPAGARRRIGPAALGLEVGPIGLGCMNLSHAYGVPPAPAAAAALLDAAIDAGVDLLDTAALYGFGANEELIGRVLADRRSRFVLASKCGMTGVDGKRVIDGRPATLQRTCEEALRRLRTDTIDLYYLHRWDRRQPIEDGAGALAQLVRDGKVRAIGLSEVSAATLRRAHAVHPIAAVQNEYSLWTRNPELGLLDACAELDVTLVAFSPLGRGFLGGALREVATLDARDIRRSMPRFAAGNFAANLALLDGFLELAAQAGCTPAQFALAWLLARDARVVPIPGTTSIAHLRENLAAGAVRLDPQLASRAAALLDPARVQGARYNAQTLVEIDTERSAADAPPATGA
jgi:aryl-alcohol dehydrogenase-like predicted oxidoreductase